MPLKAFQENYWNLSDTLAAPPPPTAGAGGYPAWQPTVVGSLFGALWEQARVYLARWRWIWAVVQRLRRLDTAQQAVVWRTLDLLDSPAYPAAQSAVRQTATTLGFSHPSAWIPYGRMLKANPGRAENVFRHVRACELTREGSVSTLSNPTANLLVELAYDDFARRGR